MSARVKPSKTLTVGPPPLPWASSSAALPLAAASAAPTRTPPVKLASIAKKLCRMEASAPLKTFTCGPAPAPVMMSALPQPLGHGLQRDPVLRIQVSMAVILREERDWTGSAPSEYGEGLLIRT